MQQNSADGAGPFCYNNDMAGARAPGLLEVIMKKALDVPTDRLIRARIPGRETGIEVKKTLCSICGSQCGIDAYVREGRLIKVEGTKEELGQ